ncbi:unnamed protein product [Victoria cruziana]
MNQNFSSMIDQYKHQQLQIGLVSPKQIRAWANKILMNGAIVGEVAKPYTFHYKTNKPEKDGLFCERIFGPIKSGICACGNYRVIGVEYVDYRIRRYQMGYIKLARPVTHVWYLKCLPSYIVNLLDKPLKELKGLVYCSFEYEIQSQKYSIPIFFTTQGSFRNREISIGATAIREQLADLDLRIIIDRSLVEWKELGEEASTENDWEDRKIGRRKDFLVRRMELAKHFLRTNVEPEWMVLSLLPVLPPELRPIIQIDGVIYQNNTLTDLLITSRSTPGELVMCQEKLVQEPIDTILDNGIRGQPMRDDHNKVYKLFSDVIEGKEERFRKTLLGKRVDYSGCSIIVVGSSLSLPREIAIELFQTFVIHGLIRQHLASNIRFAKSKIREKEPIVWEILQEVMQGHPVLLNRAPTLHRLGIQVFQPILVEGRAICLHPLVYMPMGLYVLTMDNRRGICANRYNLCNPRNHQNERIVHSNYKYRKGKEPYFCSSYDALRDYWQKGIDLYNTLWLRWRLDQHIIASINREIPIKVQYESLGTFHEIYDYYRVVRSVKKGMLCIYI